ncbi:MAG: cell division ATP-binding protein FtsE, partial [bacterium]
KLLEYKTAYENIELPLIVRGVRRKERRERTMAILCELGLVEKACLFPHQLSGGEKQRVAIGRALANSPVLLLADEPTGNLDPVTSEEIMDILVKINRRGTAVIMATHNMNIVEERGGRKLVLEKGRIVADIKG